MRIANPLDSQYMERRIVRTQWHTTALKGCAHAGTGWFNELGSRHRGLYMPVEMSFEEFFLASINTPLGEQGSITIIYNTYDLTESQSILLSSRFHLLLDYSGTSSEVVNNAAPLMLAGMGASCTYLLLVLLVLWVGLQLLLDDLFLFSTTTTFKVGLLLDRLLTSNCTAHPLILEACLFRCENDDDSLDSTPPLRSAPSVPPIDLTPMTHETSITDD